LRQWVRDGLDFVAAPDERNRLGVDLRDVAGDGRDDVDLDFLNGLLVLVQLDDDDGLERHVFEFAALHLAAGADGDLDLLGEIEGLGGRRFAAAAHLEADGFLGGVDLGDEAAEGAAVIAPALAALEVDDLDVLDDFLGVQVKGYASVFLDVGQ